MKRNRRKLSSLDKYVIFSLSMILIYTIAEFISVSFTGVEKSTLTTCYFAVFGGEVLSTALIKIHKLKRGDSDYES